MPLVIVHGGGRGIDAALEAAGIPRRQVDGLRVTDGPTLDIVVSVLAGAINTRFVAAINAAGGRAVGLTGADAAGVATVKKAPAPPRDQRRPRRSGIGRRAPCEGERRTAREGAGRPWIRAGDCLHRRVAPRAISST